jgi:hypothetical protein
MSSRERRDTEIRDKARKEELEEEHNELERRFRNTVEAIEKDNRLEAATQRIRDANEQALLRGDAPTPESERKAIERARRSPTHHLAVLAMNRGHRVRDVTPRAINFIFGSGIFCIEEQFFVDDDVNWFRKARQETRYDASRRMFMRLGTYHSMVYHAKEFMMNLIMWGVARFHMDLRYVPPGSTIQDVIQFAFRQKMEKFAKYMANPFERPTKRAMKCPHIIVSYADHVNDDRTLTILVELAKNPGGFGIFPDSPTHPLNHDFSNDPNYVITETIDCRAPPGYVI